MNFKDAEANFEQRVFLIGPNASGKSNFLDCFRFLMELATDGLEPAVTKRGGGFFDPLSIRNSLL